MPTRHLPKDQKCIYCLGVADTKDHIPSRNLFPTGMGPKNPIIVPSCAKCNRGFSRDEEYFRLYVCALAEGHSIYARQVFFSQIKRSTWRKPGMALRFRKRTKLVDFHTKAGLYLGKVARIEPTQSDWSRFSNVMDKYVKGLIFHELKSVLPSEYRIRHDIFLAEERVSDLRSRAKYLKWKSDNKDIFAYGFGVVAGTHKSVWLTQFYDSLLCESLVYTDQDLGELGIQPQVG